MKWAIIVALIVGAALGYLFYFADPAEAPLPPPPPPPAEVAVGSLRLSLADWKISTTTEASRIDVTLEDPGPRRDEVVAFVDRTLEWYEDMVDPAAMPADELAWIRESGRPYTLSIDGKASLATDGRSSYRLASFYDTGGAHPNGAMTAETYDASGERLSLADVVGPERTLERVAEAFRPRLLAAINARVNGRDAGETPYEPGEDFEAGTDPVAENYANWYLSGDDLVVIVNPYQVGPYSLGSYEVPVPLAEI